MPGNHFLLCPGRENPLGRTELPHICDANRMVARTAAIEPEKVLCCFEVCCRTALVMLLIHWCGGSWILEQPASSLMQEHPAVAAALAKCQYYKINAFLGHTGIGVGSCVHSIRTSSLIASPRVAPYGSFNCSLPANHRLLIVSGYGSLDFIGRSLSVARSSPRLFVCALAFRKPLSAPVMAK